MIDVAALKSFCTARGLNPATKLGRMLRQDPIAKSKRKAQLHREQQGICSLCPEPLDGTSEIDHIKKIAAFITEILNGEIIYSDAYDAVHARPNLRLVHKKCNRERENANGKA